MKQIFPVEVPLNNNSESKKKSEPSKNWYFPSFLGRFSLSSLYPVVRILGQVVGYILIQRHFFKKPISLTEATYETVDLKNEATKAILPMAKDIKIPWIGDASNPIWLFSNALLFLSSPVRWASSLLFGFITDAAYGWIKDAVIQKIYPNAPDFKAYDLYLLPNKLNEGEYSKYIDSYLFIKASEVELELIYITREVKVKKLNIIHLDRCNFILEVIKNTETYQPSKPFQTLLLEKHRTLFDTLWKIIASNSGHPIPKDPLERDIKELSSLISHDLSTATSHYLQKDIVPWVEQKLHSSKLVDAREWIYGTARRGMILGIKIVLWPFGMVNQLPSIIGGEQERIIDSLEHTQQIANSLESRLKEEQNFQKDTTQILLSKEQALEHEKHVLNKYQDISMWGYSDSNARETIKGIDDLIRKDPKARQDYEQKPAMFIVDFVYKQYKENNLPELPKEVKSEIESCLLKEHFNYKFITDIDFKVKTVLGTITNIVSPRIGGVQVSKINQLNQEILNHRQDLIVSQEQGRYFQKAFNAIKNKLLESETKNIPNLDPEMTEVYRSRKEQNKLCFTESDKYPSTTVQVTVSNEDLKEYVFGLLHDLLKDDPKNKINGDMSLVLDKASQKAILYAPMWAVSPKAKGIVPMSPTECMVVATFDLKTLQFEDAKPVNPKFKTKAFNNSIWKGKLKSAAKRETERALEEIKKNVNKPISNFFASVNNPETQKEILESSLPEVIELTSTNINILKTSVHLKDFETTLSYELDGKLSFKSHYKEISRFFTNKFAKKEMYDGITVSNIEILPKGKDGEFLLNVNVSGNATGCFEAVMRPEWSEHGFLLFKDLKVNDHQVDFDSSWAWVKSKFFCFISHQDKQELPGSIFQHLIESIYSVNIKKQISQFLGSTYSFFPFNINLDSSAIELSSLVIDEEGRVSGVLDIGHD